MSLAGGIWRDTSAHFRSGVLMVCKCPPMMATLSQSVFYLFAFSDLVSNIAIIIYSLSMSWHSNKCTK